MTGIDRGLLAYWRAWRHRPLSTAVATAMAFGLAVLVLAYSGAAGPSLGPRTHSDNQSNQFGSGP